MTSPLSKISWARAAWASGADFLVAADAGAPASQLLRALTYAARVPVLSLGIMVSGKQPRQEFRLLAVPTVGVCELRVSELDAALTCEGVVITDPRAAKRAAKAGAVVTASPTTTVAHLMRALDFADVPALRFALDDLAER